MITFSPSAIKIIRLAGILYLTLPIFVLYSTCFSWPFAILFDSLYVLMLFWCRGTFFEEKEVRIPTGTAACYLYLAVFLLLISGVGAFTGYQNGDIGRSNAILSDLVYNDWPVTYNDGGNVSVLNYYYAAFLSPGLIGKAFFSFRIAEMMLFVWLAIGLVLVGLFLMIALNNRRTYVLLLLAGYSGLHIIGTMIEQPGLFDGAMVLEQYAREITNRGDFIAQFESFGTAVNWCIHHYVPTMLIAFYFVEMVRHHSYKLTALLASSLLLWTPLAVFGLIPFVIVMFVAEKFDLKKFVSKADFLALAVIGLPMVMYFLSMDVKGTSGGKLLVRGILWLEHNWPVFLMFAFLEFALLWILVWNAMRERFTRTDRVVMITVICTMSGSLFIDYGACHDFSMRATIIPWMILFTYFVDSFMFADSRHRSYLVIYAVLAFLSCLPEYSRDIGETVRNNFQPHRYYWQDNTVDGSGIQFQYVGSVNSPFYRIFGKNNSGAPDSSEICSEENLLISGNGVNVYFYNDYLVFNGIAQDDARPLSIKYHYPDGQVASNDYAMSWIKYRFGSLKDSGLGGVRVADYLFSSLEVVINGESHTVSLADVRKHEKAVPTKPYVRFSKLTDANWNSGISRNGYTILVDRPSITDSHLVGKSLEYNKETYKVINVEYRPGCSLVSLDRPVSKVDESSNVAFIR